MTSPLTPPAARASRVALALGAGVLAALLGAARVADAQDPTGQFTVITKAGAFQPMRAASLETSGVVGIDALYGLTRFFGIGTTVNVARTNTRAEDFITAITLGTISAGDTTYFYETGQPVNILDGGLLAMLRLPIGDRITPYLVGGVGAYSVFLDPEINRGRRNFSGMTGTGGGGLAIRFSERAGIQLDVRNMTFFNYKADQLDPSNGRFPNAFFFDDFPSPPTRKKAVSNMVYSLGFRYVPAGRGGEPENEGEEERR
jgi:opacity protein-like surface antigen